MPQNNPLVTYSGSNIATGLASGGDGQIADLAAYSAARQRTPISGQFAGGGRVPVWLKSLLGLPAYTQNSGAASYAAQPLTAQGGSTMKARTIIILGALLLGALAFGQSDNTLHVKEFPGATVGAKIAAAQAACTAPGPCIIVIDASLAAMASGTLPAQCASCTWMDYRTGSASVNKSTTSPQTMAGALNTTALNNVYKVEQFAGATADVKLNACFAAIPAGGTCDARGFGPGNQTIAAPVAWGNSSTQTLFADPATRFQPATATTQMFNPGPNAKGFGITVDTTNTTYTAAVFLVNSNVRDSNEFLLQNIAVWGSGQASGSVCLELSASDMNHSQVFMHVRGFRCNYLHTGILATATTTGFINGNNFSDLVFDGLINGLELTTSASGSGNYVSGNSFSNYQWQTNSGAGSNPNAVYMHGTGEEWNNHITGFSCWDMITGGACLNYADSTVNQNYTEGFLNAFVTDSSTNTANVTIDNAKGGFTSYGVQLGYSNYDGGNGNGVQILSGVAALPLRRGITLPSDPDGHFNFYVNSNQNSPVFQFLDGFTGNLGLMIDAKNKLIQASQYSNSNGIVIPSAATGYTGTPSSKMVLSDNPFVTGTITDGVNTVPTVGAPTAGQAACIKSVGPPVVVGYCSTAPTAGGACTCN